MLSAVPLRGGEPARMHSHARLSQTMLSFLQACERAASSGFKLQTSIHLAAIRLPAAQNKMQLVRTKWPTGGPSALLAKTYQIHRQALHHVAVLLPFFVAHACAHYRVAKPLPIHGKHKRQCVPSGGALAGVAGSPRQVRDIKWTYSKLFQSAST